ncbi:MAG: DoxX family protein [Xanthomonadaceae bacterium]|nr:DoxX family protein [Xanthomonadaceae bacterium]
MENNMNESIGKLILRISLGGLILLHGLAKLMHGVSGLSGMVTGAGLPAFVTYGVYVGEVIAPILVLIGWYSRIGAVLIAVNMLFAIGIVHRGEVFALGPSGGWAIELQGMFLFTAIAIALIGPGRFSLNAK